VWCAISIAAQKKLVEFAKKVGAKIKWAGLAFGETSSAPPSAMPDDEQVRHRGIS